MGRKEKRLIERRNRIENRKGKVLLSRDDIRDMKQELTDTVVDTVTKNDVEVLMTCFALAEHRLYGFGKKRILRSLKYVDELMGHIVDGSKTIYDYAEELEEEAQIKVSFDE